MDTPKEKAKKLLAYYYSYFKGVKSEYSIKFLCKECALITVEEVIASHYKVLSEVNTSTYEYWQEVKRELQML
jgi:hypothetical protein